jgi:5,10-methylenetetrahydrofolate reductase
VSVSIELADCPKNMEFGPCGGVKFDGRCEVADHPCVFLDRPTVRWHGADVALPEPSAGAARMRELLGRRPIVVADFPARALDARSSAECAAILAGHVDAVLAGDSGDARVQFPPAYRARLLHDAGLTVWSGINCRDRNRVAIEGELAALALEGVGGVLCVTGDHPLAGSRPDAAPVFDLDSTSTAALARAAGHLVAVGESPASPPVERRPARLLEKVRAGAEVCFVNHCGGASPVRDFVRRARNSGAGVAFIPCLPVIVDAGSAALLRTFPSLVLPDGYADRVLYARDPFAEGIAAAVELARDFLVIDGVAGVNLSGGPGVGASAGPRSGAGSGDGGGSAAELRFAEALARIADELDLTNQVFA